MDNDNKVKKNAVEKNTEQIHKEVMLFLGDELERIHHSSTGQAYDIEKEYAKTKKNHSPFSALMLTGCFLVVIGIAFVMTRVINSRNEDITVSLSEFDDLNLKNLLNTVASAQSNYDNAVKNRAAIEGDMTVRLRAAEDTRDNDLFVIESMNLRLKKQRDEKIRQAELKYRETVSAIHQEFDGKLAQADKEIEEYKKQLAEFDATKVQAAKEKEKALDSERRVKELEQQKIKDQYESRITELSNKLSETQRQTTEDIRQAVTSVSAQYQAELALLDPKLDDSTAKTIISNNDSCDDFDGEKSMSGIGVSIPVREAVAEYQALYDDYKYLDKAVAALPQKNSIPKYVAAKRVLVNKMGEKFAGTTIKLYDENRSLNNKIASLNNELEESKQDIVNQKGYYETSYETLMSLAKTNAVLIFAEDYDKMPVYVAGKARYLIAEEGADAEFKADKTVKGKIFRAEDDTFYFVVNTDKEGNPLPVKFESVTPGTPVKILSK